MSQIVNEETNMQSAYMWLRSKKNGLLSNVDFLTLGCHSFSHS